jgi:hypothetical protein
MLEQIATLPRRFQSLANVSMFSLVEAIGYFGFHHQISEADIRAALTRCPKCIREWMQSSEDKRTSGGWYLTHIDEGCYEVGYVTERGELQQRVAYNDRTDSCAAFIKHELENIRLA